MTREELAAELRSALAPSLERVERAVNRQTWVLLAALLVVGALAGARLSLTLPGGISFSSVAER